MQPPMVSVVIPTYDRAWCLPRAIDSVLAQTHRNIEIVVVDDGSTDETSKIMESRYGHIARVRYLHQENRGVSAARNAGLAVAQGDFVALLDSDDIWFPWKLQVQLAVLRFLPNAGMVWTDMEAIDAGGRVISHRYLRTMYHAYRWFKNDDLFAAAYPLRDVVPEMGAMTEQATFFQGDVFSQMVMGNLIHTSTVLLRRERLEAVQSFDEDLKYSGEDYDFHLRTCREGPVAFIDVASIQYQQGLDDQLTHSRYAIHMATNSLKTVSKVLRRDRHRIQLSNRMVRALKADAYDAVGESAINGSNNKLARVHLVRSLWYRPWQPRLAMLLVLSLMPTKLGVSLRRTVRWMRSGSGSG